jgi:ubiquinone/menaquinone biosynthesis C-methylase UbiE
MSSTSPATESREPTDQKRGFEEHYSSLCPEDFEAGRNLNPVIRFIRERRLRLALSRLLAETHARPSDWSALVVCAGAGIDGTVLADQGFRDVTVSDFSLKALELAKALDERLKTAPLDLENLSISAGSYDLVVVQDGLHHLPRPTLGLTEMIRVARKAVIVIEPHEGVAARLAGIEWERTADAVNYVFRWNEWLFSSVIRSYLLMGSNTERILAQAPIDARRPCRLNCSDNNPCSYRILAMRVWDHNPTASRLARLLGMGQVAGSVVRLAYGAIEFFFRGLGNTFIGILVKDKGDAPNDEKAPYPDGEAS